MSSALLIARCALALIFVVAALGKLADRPGLRATLREFGLSQRLVGLAAVALPMVELAIGVLLIPSSTARPAALAALALLLLFCFAIARALARGERPGCNCFGQLHSAPVGRGTLVRNAALVAVAAAVAGAGPGKGVDTAVSDLDLAVAGATALALAFAVQAWFSWQLFRQHGRVIERLRALEAAIAAPRTDSTAAPALPPGARAPSFGLPDVRGRRRTLDDLLAARVPLALVFSDPDCAACETLVPRLERLRAAAAGALEIVLITRGGAPAQRADLAASGVDHVLLDDDGDVPPAYRIRAVPSAMIVDAEGTIASATATGDLAIEELIASTVAGVSPANRLHVVGG